VRPKETVVVPVPDARKTMTTFDPETGPAGSVPTGGALAIAPVELASRIAIAPVAARRVKSRK
jgi:hypothetical protein